MNRKVFNLVIILAVLIIPTVLTAGDGVSFWDAITPPEDISVNGHLIDWLFNYTTIMNIIFFAFVCIGLFGFSYLYYYKRHPKPYYTYGNKKSHILVGTIIGALVFVFIDMNITRVSSNDFIKVFINWPKESEKPIRVEVMAQQWAWTFRYAGDDGVFNTDDDIITVNDLRLPTNRKVTLQFSSKDVIHAFYLPNVRRKVDAMPGRISRMWFELRKTGVFDIACAEMCGAHHYKMQAKMTVYSEKDFESWRATAQKLAYSTNDQENLDSYWGWPWKY